ncbi:MAG TPA: DUF3386 family protein [Gemmataceae bacterium]|nr:DUF3386 family protein [Gemmataceae bacterium]
MRGCCLALLLALTATPARAHFIWIVPERTAPDATTARLVFSDSLEPDSPDLLAKVARTQLFACDKDGHMIDLKEADEKNSRLLTLPGQGPWVVAGVCRYGVTRHGGSEPFLLVYYPKTYVSTGHVESWPKLPRKEAERLALEIVPGGQAGTFVVLWHGKPAAGAEAAVLRLGETKAEERKADAEGRIRLDASKGGVYGIRARHDEDTPGELGGKKYKQVRSYATLVVQVGDKAGAGDPPAKKANGEVKGDPAATRLLAEARAARATWHGFPGFTADVEVNLDGRVSRGRVDVKPDGKVTLDLGKAEEDRAASAWARRELGSVVGHRLDGGGDTPTPCVFTDENAHHPLGRAIHVLDDEYHSSYRVRDRQILVVNRSMPQADVRFTITVLENRPNAEGQFLPTAFVVDSWALEGGALKSSEAHHQTWQRVGAFDLPATILVVTAGTGTQEARSLKLSGYKLLR